MDEYIERMKIIERAINYDSIPNKKFIKTLFDKNKKIWKTIQRDIDHLCACAELLNLKGVRQSKRDIDRGIKEFKLNIMRINEFLL